MVDRERVDGLAEAVTTSLERIDTDDRTASDDDADQDQGPQSHDRQERG